MIQLAELLWWQAELTAILARIGSIEMENHAPVIEMEPVDEFPEIDGVIYV